MAKRVLTNFPLLLNYVSLSQQKYSIQSQTEINERNKD